MATYNLISTVTVGSGNAASIEFTSIPQIYTDLVLKVSARTENSSGPVMDSPFVDFNGSTSSQNSRYLFTTDGTTASSGNDTRTYLAFGISRNTATANVFGNGELYIPNYTGSTYKSFSADGVAENNATAGALGFTTNLWSNTAAITSVRLTPSSGSNFLQYSSAWLYGIKNS